jgi:hypothetical protein
MEKATCRALINEQKAILYFGVTMNLALYIYSLL